MKIRLILSLAVLGALATTARAGELVTLRNGFALHCNHHADVDGHVRLYLAAGEDNFIEFLPLDISAVEQVADPPPSVVANDSSATGSATPAAEPVKDANLSPADLHEMLA